MKRLAGVSLLAVALFCAYGFVAAGEPGPDHAVWRVGYAAVGLAALAGGGWLAFGPRPRT